VPPVPAAGVPLRTPVCALKVTPLGSVPVCVIVGAGFPLAATVNVPATLTLNETELALTNAGENETSCYRFPWSTRASAVSVRKRKTELADRKYAWKVRFAPLSMILNGPVPLLIE